MKRKFSINNIVVCLVTALLLFSCKHKKGIEDNILTNSTPEKGVIHISVDESYEPIISEQIKVYENTFPEAHIIATYKSEAACIKDMEDSTVEMIVISRKLTNKESQYYDFKLGYRPPFEIMAWDAIALVINKANPDSLYTNDEISAYMKSKNDKDPEVVVDGSDATSIVRYLSDSLVNGTSFGSNVVAANGNKDVLHYIATHTNAIGFVGYSWIGIEGTKTKQLFDSNLKLGLVKCKVCKESIYARPSQATVADEQYPYYRPLVSIAKDNALGLAKGFYNYMLSERGQLVFRQAMLIPNQLNFNVRMVNIKGSKQKK